MTNDITIIADRVYKKYCSNLKRSLRYGLLDLGNEILGKNAWGGKLRRDEFWSLQNVSFELRRGESLGIIGVNGSGKTTLLNVLYGLLKPTKGKVRLRGRVGAMIQLGAGFQPVLSGRENIYTNAAILGMSNRVIKQKLDEIIEFADIGQFIDAPVQTYSKGMLMRLGFSIATHLVEPDILIVDEVLATGDIGFRSKCQKRINDIVDAGASLVLVSHSNAQIEALCQKTLFLNKGVVKGYGPTPEIIQDYLAYINQNTLALKKEESAQETNNSATHNAKMWQHADPSHFEVTKIELLNATREPQTQFCMLDSLVIRLHFVAHRPVNGLVVRLTITGLDGKEISGFKTGESDRPNWHGEGYVDCIVPELPLREGVYAIDAAAAQKESSRHTGQILFKSQSVAEFSVVPHLK
ncbi:MAG: ABC transporter ATP-binding protein, partial [Hydrococcus sp. Prado102]|nr:ABC transporter ATP-binding protein [Hydrococcus sp. Prado102]